MIFKIKKKAVFFDMDGVVVDSMRFHVKAWILALSDFGIKADEIEIFRREGMTGDSSIKEIISLYSDNSDQIDIKLLIEKKHLYFEKYEIQAYDEIFEILNYLKEKQIKLALVTGSERRSVNHLLEEKLYSLFDFIITSDDVEKGKPDPEPYLKAIEKIEIDNSFCLVVENAPMGLISAKNAGLDVVAVETTLPKKELLGADLVVRNHKELFKVIKMLNI